MSQGKSLRIASLNPSEARAPKDCRTCNRRRIRCDRSLPSCQKCDLRGLECPGYGMRIRWDQGVASRGKLSGKAIPVIESSTSARATPQSTLETGGSPTQLPIRANIMTQHIDDTPESHYREYLRRQGFRLDNPHALNIDYGATKCRLLQQDSSARVLMHYFDHVVAAVFPWLEGPGNEWREIMIPLALKSQMLLLALLALSAEHFRCKTGLPWLSRDRPCAERYKTESLLLLTEGLKSEADGDYQSQSRSKSILATILALCNLEMIGGHSKSWHIHWTAVRTIVYRWKTAHEDRPSPIDDGRRFLVCDAFMQDALACTTTFHHGAQIMGDVFDPSDVDGFIDLFMRIQEVTRVERSRQHFSTEIGLPPYLQDMDAIQRWYEDHRARYPLACAEYIHAPTEEDEHDCEALFDMYYYAGILYSYQTLVEPAKSASARPGLVQRVEEALGRITRVERLQHSYAWPIFIIGTEARHYPRTQHLVERELTAIMNLTSWRNLVPALDFLRRFWVMSDEEAPEWRPVASAEAARGLSFLVM